MKVIVVGIGGVGMAHVCAAVRNGYSIVAVVDIDSGVLERSKSSWSNRWLDLSESVVPQEDVVYCRYLSDLIGIDIGQTDLIILCTPPDTHVTLAKYCLDNFPARVLVEKPISIESSSLADDRLILSTEWIYHSKGFPSNIDSLGMCYPKSSTTNWGYNLPAVLDFGPHLFSILVSEGYNIAGIEKRWLGKDGFHLIAFVDEGYVNLFGSRAGENFGLFVNGELFDWEDNLFDKQLFAIESGAKGVEWKRMLDLENLVKKFLL